jgi:fructokinase
VAWDYIEQNVKLKTFAEEVDAICFGSLAQRSRVSKATIGSFLENTRSDCLKVFDINLRQSFYTKETILKSLEFANVLKLNDDELSVLSSIIGYEGDEESVLRQLLKEFDLKLIAFTKGAMGSILLTHTEISHCEVQKVEVEDTVGAGDSFTAFLMAGILNNLELKKIHRAATNVASYVCTQPGATPKLPEELIETIKINI